MSKYKINNLAFQTRARTVDHLGREQIADCPTAISELWKNAFDAYATSVSLDIYDGIEPVAVISDDGHGMNRLEFENKWLVVGTESKASQEESKAEDRDGLAKRPRQGQKGIGRLSCANLGPILLLVSKRKSEPFIAAMVDWRLFENPYLNLADIHIPVAEFGSKDELLTLLPEFVVGISENIIGCDDLARSDRLKSAWEAYNRMYEDNLEQGSIYNEGFKLPSESIIQSIESVAFSNRHFEQWPVWNGLEESGTILLVSSINYDLRVEVESANLDQTARHSRDRFFETLAGFVDPFINPEEIESRTNELNFTYTVRTWIGQTSRVIVGSTKQFDRTMLDGMEHQIIGRVNVNGEFKGQIKAFGEWIPELCVIEPPKDTAIPQRIDSVVGSFDLYIAAMEFAPLNTTHTDQEFERYSELAKKYAGFMVYRDGLRVLPYGRTDNDFFEIESRRTKHSGREFWNHRQMFGRVAISRVGNPNLKDKAGREGFLDNRSAKAFKTIVANILMVAARRYFGTDSKVRHELLPEIRTANELERAAVARKKLRQRNKREFKSRLKKTNIIMPEITHELGEFSKNLSITNDNDIISTQERLEDFRERLAETKLRGAPKKLDSLEADYNQYLREYRAASDILSRINVELESAIEQFQPKEPRQLLESKVASYGSQISRRIQISRSAISRLQESEMDRVRNLVSERNKMFRNESIPILARYDRGELDYARASSELDSLKSNIDEENRHLFDSYVSILESLQESIDLEQLATLGLDEVSTLRGEVERLNSLAQLGIAVEIIGHELESYDDMIGAGLEALPASLQSSSAVKNIELGYNGLTDQLRFLSPLRLSGRRSQTWITGQEISDYINHFFKSRFERSAISLNVDPKFNLFRVLDQRSRLLPVFINLVNNSVYWIASGSYERREISLTMIGNDVVISDSGPGVEPADVERLFSMFFTKKAAGGRGVGLFLAKANLAAGGHKIRYEESIEGVPLRGAHFVITFRGDITHE
jgi:signal transduction histidine kinase